MKAFSRTAAALALVAGAVAPVGWLGASAGAASGAWTGGPVTIRVELDLPNGAGSTGPLVQQVTGVIPGDQVELTSNDVIENPSKWCGTAQVDIDPVTHTVTVGTGQVWDGEGTPGPITAPIDELSPGYSWDDCNFQTAKVTITGGGFGTFTVVSDNLWGNRVLADDVARAAAAEPAAMPKMVLATNVESGDASASWTADPADSDLYLIAGGTAVFSYTMAEAPTTTVTTPTTQAPSTTQPAIAPAAATPVKATPAYTG